MSQTVQAKRGDTLVKIAKAAGFANWRTVYDAAENADLRKKTKNPPVLVEGDKVFVPDFKPMQITLKAGRTYLIKTKSLYAMVELLLNDPDGKPYASKKWELDVGDQVYSGTTTAQGGIKQKVDADAKQGNLTVFLDGGQKLEWTIDIGGLDPIGTVSGIQCRLNNLGYDTGDDALGTLGPGTDKALRDFQKDEGLPVTGLIDDATRAKIKAKHGS